MNRKPPTIHKPCNNCPFLKTGYIELMPGRVRGIIKFLMQSDYHGFPCHKTTDGGETLQGPRVAECAGAMIYRFKAQRPSAYMRVMCNVTESLNVERLMKHAPLVIDHPYKGRR